MQQAINDFVNSSDQYKVICLSTAHIRQSDAERLREMGEDIEVSMILSRETGGFVKLYPDLEDEPRILEADYPGFSDEFYNVLNQAKLAGFTMVEFDNAATEYEFLPAFDW